MDKIIRLAFENLTSLHSSPPAFRALLMALGAFSMAVGIVFPFEPWSKFQWAYRSLQTALTLVGAGACLYGFIALAIDWHTLCTWKFRDAILNFCLRFLTAFGLLITMVIGPLLVYFKFLTLPYFPVIFFGGMAIFCGGFLTAYRLCSCPNKNLGGLVGDSCRIHKHCARDTASAGTKN